MIPEFQNRVTYYDVQTELLTLKFYVFSSFELVTRCEINFNIGLELVTRDF